MVRFSMSTALYLAAATFLAAVMLPASMDFAATQLGGPASQFYYDYGYSPPVAYR